MPGVDDPKGGDAVASPCVSVCVMDPARGLCIGCLRTLDEIASWSTLDDAGRRAVLAAIERRRLAEDPDARRR